MDLQVGLAGQQMTLEGSLGAARLALRGIQFETAASTRDPQRICAAHMRVEIINQGGHASELDTTDVVAHYPEGVTHAELQPFPESAWGFNASQPNVHIRGRPFEEAIPEGARRVLVFDLEPLAAHWHEYTEVQLTIRAILGSGDVVILHPELSSPPILVDSELFPEFCSPE